MVKNHNLILNYSYQKKGALPSTVIFVILTLVLTISALGIYSTNFGKLNVEFQGPNTLEELNVRENLAKYYIFTIGSDLLSENLLTANNFKSNFLKLHFKEQFLKDLQNTISEGKFKITGEKFELIGKGFLFKLENEKFKVNHFSNLKVRFINYSIKDN